MKKHILIAALLLLACTATAQDEPAPLETDRPDQTESSNVVPHRSIQLETGMVRELTRDENGEEVRGLSVPTNLLRIGILKRMELRIITEYADYRRFAGDEELEHPTGLSEIAIGTKIKVTDEKGLLPEISVNYHVHLPLKTGSYKTDFSSSSFRFLFGHTLTEKSSLSYNLGYSFSSQGEPSVFEYTLAYGRDLTPNIGAYIEVFGFVPEASTFRVQQHNFDGGVTWRPWHNIQFDASAGYQWNVWGAYNYYSLGFSCRFPR